MRNRGTITCSARLYSIQVIILTDIRKRSYIVGGWRTGLIGRYRTTQNRHSCYQRNIKRFTVRGDGTCIDCSAPVSQKKSILLHPPCRSVIVKQLGLVRIIIITSGRICHHHTNTLQLILPGTDTGINTFGRHPDVIHSQRHSFLLIRFQDIRLHHRTPRQDA